MIKSLRRKFIAIAMCSITLVLAAIMIGINVASYLDICKTADERIALISGNSGIFPDDFRFGHKPLSPEAPFDTRYFTVTLSEDGTVLQINTGKIAETSTSDASAYATSLWSRHKTKGFIGNYRYQAVASTFGSKDSATMYIFLYFEREIDAFRTFLLASIGISLAGLLIVFILVVIFSKMAVKPVAESYEKQKRFITDASHELRTPLTIIDANTEVIEMTTGENQWTKSTRHQIRRLTTLTEKLVFLSRMDEDSARLEMFEFNLSEAIADTADSFLAAATAKGKTLTLNIQADVTIKGDEATLRQLVSLLLDNAIKYSPESGVIRLDFYTNGKTKVLSVWNTTEPIPVGKHDELFERFYRREKSRNLKTGGYGIGLSVAQAIVNAHKGKISAVSEDGQSLCFTATLP